MLATEAPFPQYFDSDGSPLHSGFLYYGAANQNPETNPITVYWDVAGTQPAAQPIRTLNGFAQRAGTAAVVYTPGDYSLTVRDRTGRLLPSVQSSANIANTALVLAQLAAYEALLASGQGPGNLGYDMGLTYAANTVGFKLKGVNSICDLLNGAAGAIADGNITAGTGTDNSARIQARVNALGVNGCLYVPPGVFLCLSQITIPSEFTLYGAGNFCSILTTTNAFNSDGLLKLNGIGGAPTNISKLAVVAQNGGAGASSYGINSVANGVFISDVWVSGFKTCVTLASSDNFLANSALEEPAAGGTCLEITSSEVTVSNVVLYHGYIGCAIHDYAFVSGTVSLSNVRANACTYESYLISNASNVLMTGCSAGGSNVGQNTHAALAIAGSSNITITGFIARTGGGPSTVAPGIDMTVAGNSNIVINGGQLVGWLDGLTATGVSGLVVGGVQAINNYRNGFNINGGDRVSLSNCEAINQGSAAVTDAGFNLNSTDGSALWTVTGNTATQNGGGAQDYGFKVSLTDNGANTGYITLMGNTALYNGVADMALTGATQNINQSKNTLGVLTGGFVQIASAATVAIPVVGDIFGIFGNTTITNISNPQAGRRVSLIFSSVLTVTDGGNLKLNGNFVTTADDTLTLVGDGANWYETGRSVN